MISSKAKDQLSEREGKKEEREDAPGKLAHCVFSAERRRKKRKEVNSNSPYPAPIIGHGMIE